MRARRKLLQQFWAGDAAAGNPRLVAGEQPHPGDITQCAIQRLHGTAELRERHDRNTGVSVANAAQQRRTYAVRLGGGGVVLTKGSERTQVRLEDVVE